MRIKLLTNLGGEGEDYLNAVILLKTPHKNIKTTFILDTGSPQSVIGYGDSKGCKFLLLNLIK